MGLFDKVERGLERAVNGVFAKAFKAEVQPVEIASAIRKAMDDRAAVMGHGRTMCPNLYTIELSATDHERLGVYEDDLVEELVAAAKDHVDTQRYTPGGPLQVIIDEDDELETGVFRVRPATSRHPVTSTSKRAKRAAGYAEDAAPQPHPATAASDALAEHAAAHGDEAVSGLDGASVAAAHAPEGTPLSPVAPAPAAGTTATSGTSAAGSTAAAARAGADASHSSTAPHAPAAESHPVVVNPTRRPYLDIDGERYPLIGALTILGRDESADIIIDDPGVSRQHSEIRVTTDGPHQVASIRDLGSTNGTFVNAERITSQRLEDGDDLVLGRTRMTFRIGERGGRR